MTAKTILYFYTMFSRILLEIVVLYVLLNDVSAKISVITFTVVLYELLVNGRFPKSQASISPSIILRHILHSM